MDEAQRRGDLRHHRQPLQALALGPGDEEARRRRAPRFTCTSSTGRPTASWSCRACQRDHLGGRCWPTPTKPLPTARKGIDVVVTATQAPRPTPCARWSCWRSRAIWTSSRCCRPRPPTARSVSWPTTRSARRQGQIEGGHRGSNIGFWLDPADWVGLALPGHQARQVCRVGRNRLPRQRLLRGQHRFH